MKYAAVAVLLVLSSMSNMVDTCCAQSLDILTGLHPRPKVSYFRGVGSIAISPSTPILISDTASAVALEYLESILQKKLGYTLTPFRGTFKAGIPNAIYLGEHGSYPALDSALNTSLASGEYTPGAQGYVLDISSSGIVLAGTDANGTFNSISTFAQLLKGDSLPLVHINDWPDYPIRWVFSTHNLIVPDQITALETIEDSMAAHKLNGLQQNDFKNNVYSIFENSYPQYFYNVDSLQTHSYNANVELIPGLFPIGWSEGILFHDPDIAEGIPTTSNYYIEGDTGRLIGDPRVSVPHGDFENASNGTFPGWNWYDPTIFVDSSTVHSGHYSARATNFSDTTPNGRFIKLLTCNPHSGYHMSAWYKTQGFSGEFNLLAIGFHGSDSRGLTYTQFGVPATSNGWQQVNVIFNTLGYDSMYVYCGVWSGSAGTIWFDDFHIEDAGMTNLLRPASELPTVTESNAPTSYKEGRDYAMLVDSVMEKNQGTYPWHASPGFKVLPGSKIQNGDTVQVHFIRPNPVENDPTGDGSTMVCVSEDTLYPILHDQMALVDAQYHSNKYFMSHDEIREMNWDSACQSRKLSPAQLLADNVRKCDSIMHEVHPGAEVFDWSDMFDSLHNAHDNYYLVNGDLSGDWNLIPKDLTIVNWNGGNMSQSLNFFSKLGFSQITSPYYDVQNTNNIRAWRLAMDTIPNMRGMMYTTWANDYSFLTPFADYAWSAGPMIVHRPLDTANLKQAPGGFDIEADVFPDLYDPSDSIVSVVARADNCWDFIESDSLINVGNHHFKGVIKYLPCEYIITAVNKQGLSRNTPEYHTGMGFGSVSTIAPDMPRVEIFPNPATNTLTIRSNGSRRANILIEDLLGREVARFEATSASSTLDLQNIPAGIYECIVTDASGARTSLPFVKE